MSNLDENIENLRNASVSEAIALIKEDPQGNHALHYLDIIDAKVNAIFTFIGVLIAAVVIFISGEIEYVEKTFWGFIISQRYFVFGALGILITASIFALSCLHIIEIGSLVRRKKSADRVLKQINKITRSRRWRYLIALRLTAFGTLLAATAVFLSF